MNYRLSLLIGAALFLGGCGKDDAPLPDAELADTAPVDAGDTVPGDGGDPDPADGGEDDVDATEAESEAPISGPPPGYTAVEHRVFVHVTDGSGAPIPGATIFLNASAAVANDDGDAVFDHVGPGNYALSARNGGFVDGLWDIEIPHLNPLEIEIPHLIERRYFAALTPIAEASEFIGADGASVTSGVNEFEVGASVLTGHDGTEDGTIEAELTLGAGTLSSGTTALSTDGTPQTLDPVGSFDLTFLDEDGVPLQLVEGETILARLDADGAFAPGTLFQTYVLDRLTGVWHEEPGNEAEVSADGFVEIEIPHLSRWAFGSPLARDAGCARVTVPGFADYPDALIRVDAESGSYALPVVSETVDIPRLIPGENISATLYLGAERFESLSLRAVAETNDATTCGEFADPGSFEVPTPLNTGVGSARVRLHLRSGTCPARSVTLLLTDEFSEFASIEATATNTVVMTGVPEGRYTATANLSGIGAGRLEFAVDCTDCELDFRFDLEPGFAADVKGGCSVLPCFGAECTSCVSLAVRDGFNSPVSGTRVSAFEPLDEVFSIDDAGELCLDVPTVDNRVLFSSHRFDAVAAPRLPRAASCADGGCAEIALIESPRINCADGPRFDDALGVELGHFDPRYSNLGDFASTPERARSFFRAVVRGDTSDPLGSVLAGEPTILDGAVALNLVQQNRVGDEVIQGLSIRVVLPESGLGFDLTLPASAARGGTFDLAGGVASIQTPVLPVGPDDRFDVSSSVSGTAVVSGIGGGRISVLLEGVFDDATLGSADISLIAIAPILTEADSDRNLLAQRSQPVNGRAVRVLTSERPDGYVDTMTGMLTGDDYPAGEFDFCAPSTEFYMMRGEDIPGLVTPITSLYSVADTEVSLYDNDAEGAASFVTADLRWFDRDFLGLMYRGVGADPADIATSGTITGRFADQDGFLLQAGRVTLELGGEVIDAFLVGDDFRPATSTSLYFFPSVPPTTLDEPYTLRAYRTDATEVVEFRQRVVPMAGTALIPHP